MKGRNSKLKREIYESFKRKGKRSLREGKLNTRDAKEINPYLENFPDGSPAVGYLPPDETAGTILVCGNMNEADVPAMVEIDFLDEDYEPSNILIKNYDSKEDAIREAESIINQGLLDSVDNVGRIESLGFMSA